MKPTKEQIEKYIKYADLEAGPDCADSWFEWCRNLLRTAVIAKGPILVLTEDGFVADAEISVGGSGGGPHT